MPMQTSVQPAESDLQKDAEQRGIRSGSGYKASGFEGGDTDKQSGNVQPATDQEIRFGREPTSRLSSLTASQGEGGPQANDAPFFAPSQPTQTQTTRQPSYSAPKTDNTAMWVTMGLTVLTALCYASGTLMAMADGSWKPVEDIDLGDDMMLGGRVTATGRALALDEVYKYKGQIVTGYHVVHEDGRFVHVRDSRLGVPMVLNEPIIVHPIVNAHHLIVTPTHVAADFAETDNGQNQTPEARLAELNGSAEIRRRIAHLDRAVFDAAPLPDRGRMVA